MIAILSCAHRALFSPKVSFLLSSVDRLLAPPAGDDLEDQAAEDDEGENHCEGIVLASCTLLVDSYPKSLGRALALQYAISTSILYPAFSRILGKSSGMQKILVRNQVRAFTNEAQGRPRNTDLSCD